MAQEVSNERFDYEAVAAGQTAQKLGGNGAIGDYLSHVTIQPAIAACGLVSILDGATTILTFPGGGTTALPSLGPFTMCVGAKSRNGAWAITTGASIAAIGVGNFT